MKKYLILTYDYELFLGRRSGTVAQCQIIPTEKTLSILKKHQAKAIFFTDTLQLVRLKELAANGNIHAQKDFALLKEQFEKIISLGHYIYPHIHTHWLDAVYDSSTHQWNLSDVSRYRFHQCNAETRKEAFIRSIEILKEIILPIVPDYKLDGFRAGGWCIQPFSDFRNLFIEHGLRYEMSVLPGFYSFTNAQHFDFTDCPGKNIYRFEEDECIEKENGRFIQLTVSSVPFTSVHRILDRIWLKFSPYFIKNNLPASGNGHASQPLIPQPEKRKPGFDVMQNLRQRIAVELLTPVSMPLYKSFLKGNDYMHFLSHPKMITRNHHLLFEKFLDDAFKNFEVITDFKICLKEKGLE
ncbi:MAG: hypothetical protein JNL47_08160 [Bacteroidia bacterium]|nr:hypothetical protein [Bacteroidia bacterium]